MRSIPILCRSKSILLRRRHTHRSVRLGYVRLVSRAQCEPIRAFARPRAMRLALCAGSFVLMSACTGGSSQTQPQPPSPSPAPSLAVPKGVHAANVITSAEAHKFGNVGSLHSVGPVRKYASGLPNLPPHMRAVGWAATPSSDGWTLTLHIGSCVASHPIDVLQARDLVLIRVSGPFEGDVGFCGFPYSRVVSLDAPLAGRKLLRA